MNSDWLKSRPVKYLFLSSRLLLGAVFVLAGADKLFHPGEFAGIISNYQILPDHLVNIAAVVLPWLETLVGLLILAGWWLPGALALADSLLIVFLVALGLAAARGIDIDCGCFSLNPTGAPNFVWYLSRDLFFLLLGGAVTAQTLIRSSGNQRVPETT
ncbi:MAG: MauE/DoxX family redox-associated membrane protein [Syntrophobacteraceae bacterium]|nr:MauE/DoxX family redox-associated membrane protein [Syntrophobacteraceae bacterium]